MPQPGNVSANSTASWRRISVVGSTGSGKTHFAAALSVRLGLPHIELDDLRNASGHGGDGGVDAFRQSIEEAVARERWIIDGHYRKYRHLIWDEADLVVHLDYPLWVVAQQLFKRYLSKRRLRKAGSAAGQSGAGEAESRHGSASWGKRLRRFARTLAERREYARELERIDNPSFRVLRFDSQDAALAWIESL